MKLHKYLIAGLAVIATVLQSCEQDVANFEMSAKPLLVTTAFISPQDTALMVELSRTQPALGRHLKEEQLQVRNATVTISDGSKQVQLVYNQMLDKYFAPIASLPVVGGKAYFLKVTTPTGEIAEGSCVVPSLQGISITELNFESRQSDMHGYSMVDNMLSFKWQDAPGVENYYHATAYRSYYITHSYPSVQVLQHELAYGSDWQGFMKDASQDGGIMQSPEFRISSGFPDHAPKPFKVFAVLSVTDRAYYQYHQTLINQERVLGNPFAEPRLIFSNMKGSLGVFAAYNQIRVFRTIQ
jgi:hypothetical protein